MNKINKDSTLLDFVQVYRQALTTKQCESVINKTTNLDWYKHEWHAYNTTVSKDDNEFDRVEVSNPMSRLMLSGCINWCINQYVDKTRTLGVNFGFNGMTIPLINRYGPGHLMLPHIDHITSIFDGEKKGIPTLSVLGLLNKDFVGGQFKLWKEHIIDLNVGDILIFPSNFMYEHHVDVITDGTRYSFVSWIY